MVELAKTLNRCRDANYLKTGWLPTTALNGALCEGGSHVCTQSLHASEGQRSRVHPDSGKGSPSPASKTKRIQGRNHVCRTRRKGSIRHQFVGPGRERGSLQPRSLRRSGEGSGEGD